MQDLGTRGPPFLSQVAQHYNTEELGFGMHGVRYQPTTQAQELATERGFCDEILRTFRGFDPLMQDLGTREPLFLSQVAQPIIQKS